MTAAASTALQNMKRLLFTLTLLAAATLNAFAVPTTTVDWFNNNATAFRDAAGNPLAQGAAALNSDGMLVQLGYFTAATPANKFAGTWMPITGVAGVARTTVGDSHNLTGAGAGRIQFNTYFTSGSAQVNVYAPGDTGAYASAAAQAISGTTPPNNQILAIRFYDTSDGADGSYNTVSSDSWRWSSPTEAGAVVTIDVANSTLAFQDSANAFRTTLLVNPPPPTPTPTATPTPTPTPTPVPTATPTATPSPTATATPVPTATPTPTAQPTPSPTATPLPAPRQLLNIATRLRVQSGENVLIGGLIVTGNDKKKVIIRAIGPSLSAVFDGALQDTTLELYQGDTLLASNDNWKDSQRQEIEDTTIPPSDDRESAIVYTVDPGFYTAIMSGKGATSGIGVIEVYDLDQAANSQLANIASRGFVEAGENVMIGGLIVGGNGTSDARILLRAIGPSLGLAGVAGALGDPVMELRDANGEVVRENDNWQDTQAADIVGTTIPPSHPAESAIVINLPSGNYTAVVRGKNGGVGVGLVEVYNLR
jgi:hypothetical protein